MLKAALNPVSFKGIYGTAIQKDGTVQKFEVKPRGNFGEFITIKGDKDNMTIDSSFGTDVSQFKNKVYKSIVVDKIDVFETLSVKGNAEVKVGEVKDNGHLEIKDKAQATVNNSDAKTVLSVGDSAIGNFENVKGHLYISGNGQASAKEASGSVLMFETKNAVFKAEKLKGNLSLNEILPDPDKKLNKRATATVDKVYVGATISQNGDSSGTYKDFGCQLEDGTKPEYNYSSLNLYDQALANINKASILSKVSRKDNAKFKIEEPEEGLKIYDWGAI